MTSTHLAEHPDRTSRRVRRRAGQGLLMAPLVVVIALALGAIAVIGYLLWPRWPGAAIAPDAPAFPITVAGVAFNVPPAAIRVKVQRRPGAHERVDLVFLWPSLEPPDPNAKPPPPTGTAPAPRPTFERIFMTIAGAGDTLAPAERVMTIYPRYTASEALHGPGELTTLAFREGTPYQGEDLIYDATAPGFLVRCTRNGAGPTPGTCLYEKRIGAADLVVRFPRDWLGDWRAVAGKMDRLIASLRPPGS
ncbi:MAG: hypothetical protein ABWY92_17765 [Xanthobacteraceae bacterium]|jgi:hypothetical protein